MLFAGLVFAVVAGGLFVLDARGYELSLPELHAFQFVDTGVEGVRVVALEGLLMAVVFSFVVSLLFYGFGAPFALGFEALRFVSLRLSGGLHSFDLVFLLPVFFACFAGSSLADAARWEESSGWPSSASFGKALGLLVLSVALVVAGVAVRSLFVA